MNFELTVPGRILFGAGKRREIAREVLQHGKRVLLVTGRSRARAEFLMEGLRSGGGSVWSVSIAGEPTVGAIEKDLEEVREFGAEVVIGIGGGSVIDGAKAIAALVTNEGAVVEYLEVIGKGKPLQRAPLPLIAVPTTSGTGAEATRNAVLNSPEHQVKVSLRSPLMLPKLAVVDPELTCDLPAEVTAYTGLDALTQLIEAFVCSRANAFTDGLCREGIPLAARSLEVAYFEPENMGARTELSLASLFSGMALANAGLGAVHGFAAPIGGMYSAPHGAVCAALLVPVMEVNYGALRERKAGAPLLQRFEELGELICGHGKGFGAALEKLQELRTHLSIPGLSRWGLKWEESQEICRRARVASSMKGNPLDLTDAELELILKKAL